MSDFSACVIGVVEGAQPVPDADFAALARDRGGALVTAGTGNTYTVHTESHLTEFGAGLALLVRIDRANTAPAYLAPDGLVPRPWLDRDGQPFAAGRLRPGHYVWAIPDPSRGAWISDLFGGLTVALLDALQRDWWLSLPDDPRGIGPNAPWRNGGALAWTNPDNPTFTFESPDGRRLAMKLILEALPTSPDGIGPNEPWNNGGTLAVTDGGNPLFDADSVTARRLTLKRFREALPATPDGLAPGEPYLNGDMLAFVPGA